jgi:hypothetical protein
LYFHIQTVFSRLGNPQGTSRKRRLMGKRIQVRLSGTRAHWTRWLHANRTVLRCERSFLRISVQMTRHKRSSYHRRSRHHEEHDWYGRNRKHGCVRVWSSEYPGTRGTSAHGAAKGRVGR